MHSKREGTQSKNHSKNKSKMNNDLSHLPAVSSKKITAKHKHTAATKVVMSVVTPQRASENADQNNGNFITNNHETVRNLHALNSISSKILDLNDSIAAETIQASGGISRFDEFKEKDRYELQLFSKEFTAETVRPLDQMHSLDFPSNRIFDLKPGDSGHINSLQ